MARRSKTLVLTASVLCVAALRPAPAEEHVVGMEGWEFYPAELTIRVGDTVVWHNDDDTAHNIAFEIERDGLPTMQRPRKVPLNRPWRKSITASCE